MSGNTTPRDTHLDDYPTWTNNIGIFGEVGVISNQTPLFKGNYQGGNQNYIWFSDKEVAEIYGPATMFAIKSEHIHLINMGDPEFVRGFRNAYPEYQEVFDKSFKVIDNKVHRFLCRDSDRIVAELLEDYTQDYKIQGWFHFELDCIVSSEKMKPEIMLFKTDCVEVTKCQIQYPSVRFYELLEITKKNKF